MTDLDAARQGDDAAFARVIAPFRRELRAHCYRMAGSLHDADDLLQETLVRAWRGLAGFEGRASLRTWLYKVATHTCLDKLDRKAPRVIVAAPEDPAPAYLEPCPAELYVDPSPETQLVQRQSVALAFLVTLQTLTPKQRAVLILRDVVGMSAAECAELLELTVPAVNSALQRAHAALAERPAPTFDATADRELLARYVAAWESTDADRLIALLREDAILAMPPMPDVFHGAAAIGRAVGDMVFASHPRFRLVAIEANGRPAFAMYEDGQPRAIHVLDIAGGRIAAITAFLDPSLFAAFGLTA